MEARYEGIYGSSDLVPGRLHVSQKKSEIWQDNVLTSTGLSRPNGKMERAYGYLISK